MMMDKDLKTGLILGAICLAAFFVFNNPAAKVSAETAKPATTQVVPSQLTLTASEASAARATAILMLAVEKCNLAMFDSRKAIKMAEDVSRRVGVDPASYPKDEWMRKIVFTIRQTPELRRVDDDDPHAVRGFCIDIGSLYPN